MDFITELHDVTDILFAACYFKAEFADKVTDERVKVVNAAKSKSPNSNEWYDCIIFANDHETMVVDVKTFINRFKVVRKYDTERS